LFEKFLQEEKNKQTITYKLDYDNMITRDYIKNYGIEGIEFINQETIRKHRSVITYVIKKIGSNLLSGKSIMNVSLPIYIFDQKSLLERYYRLIKKITSTLKKSFAYDFKVINNYLERAAEETTIEKLKLVFYFFVN
jgi:hypothetical protein